MRIALTLLCFLTYSCSQQQESKNFVVMKDDLGRKVNVPHKITKVLPLAASLTEVLYALKAEDFIVGVTQNSDYPPEASNNPVVITWPNINYEKILELDPDIVLMVNSLHSIQVVEKIESLGYPVYIFKYNNTDAIFDGIRTIGKILDISKRGNILADSLENKYDRICNRSNSEPRVVHLISLGPIYAHGKKSFVSDKIECAGGVNPIGQYSGLQNPQLSREYLLKINPQIIFAVDSITMVTSFFEKYPELKQIDAYKSWDVYDLSDYGHSRPSPRVVSSTIYMKEIIDHWIGRQTQ